MELFIDLKQHVLKLSLDKKVALAIIPILAIGLLHYWPLLSKLSS